MGRQDEIFGTIRENSGIHVRGIMEKKRYKNADHVVYARQLCPAGSAAYYDVDDGQPVGKYGRTIATV